MFTLCQKFANPMILVSFLGEEAGAGHWEVVEERRQKAAGEEVLHRHIVG